MKAIALLGLAALLAGCELLSRPTFIEPEPPLLESPTPPPERILRLPVNYRFRDAASGKEFFLRLYRDAEIEDNVVTVIDADSLGERLAEPDEFDFAMEQFVRIWVDSGDEEQLDHERQLIRRERRRSATLLDDLIRYKLEATARLQLQVDEINADLASTRRTGYPAPAGRTEFLNTRLASLETQLIGERAELRLLESRRRVRDGSSGLDELEQLLAE